MESHKWRIGARNVIVEAYLTHNVFKAVRNTQVAIEKVLRTVMIGAVTPVSTFVSVLNNASAVSSIVERFSLPTNRFNNRPLQADPNKTRSAPDRVTTRLR